MLFGPTAVGKTDLIASLGLPLEVINADSMQVYRGLDIGTAKPPPEITSRIPHHLIDLCDPGEQFHAGRFVEETERLLPEILERGRLPVVSGGTAFYFRNLIYGLPETPQADPGTRRALQERLAEEGVERLYRELELVDPESAARIEGADSYRILRALEVYRSTGKPRSAFPPPTEPRKDLEYRAVGLYRERAHLYDRINRRVESMFEHGLPGEVADLLASGVPQDAPALRAIGYREFLIHAPTDQIIARRIPEQTLELIQREIAKNSRRYAKRQITFFSRLPGVRWIEPGEEQELRLAAEALLGEG
ncbi:MAG: tRNA (adenosine(37)-N6)-dimethylallyltransferase MiaA [Alkalispirochaetaceae bacterium]